MNVQMFKLDVEKAEEPEIKSPTSSWITEKAREFQNNVYFWFIDYAKAFDWMGHKKLWKMLKEMEIPDHLTCLLRKLYAGQEATVSTRRETTDGSKLGTEYDKDACYHPAHLTYIQSISCEMLD